MPRHELEPPPVAIQFTLWNGSRSRAIVSIAEAWDLNRLNLRRIYCNMLRQALTIGGRVTVRRIRYAQPQAV